MSKRKAPEPDLSEEEEEYVTRRFRTKDNSYSVKRRSRDGYFIADQLSDRLTGYADYKKTPQAMELLKEDSQFEEDEEDEEEEMVTWIHPKLAIHFAQWVDSDLTKHVVDWATQYLVDKKTPTPLDNAKKKLKFFIELRDEVFSNALPESCLSGACDFFNYVCKMQE